MFLNDLNHINLNRVLSGRHGNYKTKKRNSMKDKETMCNACIAILSKLKDINDLLASSQITIQLAVSTLPRSFTYQVFHLLLCKRKIRVMLHVFM